MVKLSQLTRGASTGLEIGQAPRQQPVSMNTLMSSGLNPEKIREAGNTIGSALQEQVQKENNLKKTKLVLDRTSKASEAFRLKFDQMSKLKGEKAMNVGSEALSFADGITRQSLAGVEDESTRLAIINQINNERASFLNRSNTYGTRQQEAALSSSLELSISNGVQSFQGLPYENENKWRQDLAQQVTATGMNLGMSEEEVQARIMGAYSAAYTSKALSIASLNKDNPNVAMDYFKENQKFIIPTERVNVLNSLNGKIEQGKREQVNNLEEGVSIALSKADDALLYAEKTGNSSAINAASLELINLSNKMKTYNPERAEQLQIKAQDLKQKSMIATNSFTVSQQIKEVPLSERKEYINDHFKLASSVGAKYFYNLKNNLLSNLTGEMKDKARELTGERLEDAMAYAQATGDFKRVDDLVKESKTILSKEDAEKLEGTISLSKEAYKVISDKESSLEDKMGYISSKLKDIGLEPENLIKEYTDTLAQVQKQIARDVKSFKSSPADYVMSKGLVSEGMRGENLMASRLEAIKKQGEGLIDIEKVSLLTKGETDLLKSRFYGENESQGKIDFIMSLENEYGKYSDKVESSLGFPVAATLAVDIYKGDPRDGSEVANLLMQASTTKRADIPTTKDLTPSVIYSDLESSDIYSIYAKRANLMPSNTSVVTGVKSLQDSLFNAALLSGNTELFGKMDELIGAVDEDDILATFNPNELDEDTFIDALRQKKENFIKTLDMENKSIPSGVIRNSFDNNAIWIDDGQGGYILYNKATRMPFEGSRVSVEDLLKEDVKRGFWQ